MSGASARGRSQLRLAIAVVIWVDRLLGGWVDPITRGLPPSQLNVAAVHFTPGARTAWHYHDGGQTLYVTEGRGQVQARGQERVELNPGDVVYAPDGEEHWHGSAPGHFMTHLTITEGGPHWGPHVTDAEYNG